MGGIRKECQVQCPLNGNFCFIIIISSGDVGSSLGEREEHTRGLVGRNSQKLYRKGDLTDSGNSGGALCAGCCARNFSAFFFFNPDHKLSLSQLSLFLGNTDDFFNVCMSHAILGIT